LTADSWVVPRTGIEPVRRLRRRQILSLQCLPISPPGQADECSGERRKIFCPACAQCQNRCIVEVFADRDTRNDQDTSQSEDIAQAICGISSVGRAIPCQGIGREFESLIPLHLPKGSQHQLTSLFHRAIEIVLAAFRGAVAKRLCTGLQIRVGRFDSGPRLHLLSPCCFAWRASPLQSRHGMHDHVRPVQR
jgi:hypothetical protein